MIKKIKELVLNKSTLLGIVLTVGIFSKYIFSPNNLIEEIDELVLKIITGQDINFSPEVPENPKEDLNRILEYKHSSSKMKISEKGLNLIKKWEEFRAVEYFCSDHKRTIGYGHVIKDGEKYGEITEKQAKELLRQDVATAEYTINKGVRVSLKQDQFDALVSLVYNWGGGNFLRSRGLKKLNNGDYQGAAEEFKEVIKDKPGGTILKGLVNRRLAEAKLFNSMEETIA